MMPVTHHIPDEFLLAYSAGVLPEAFSLVVACHVSLSDDSRARLDAFEAVGGAVMESAPTAPMSAGALDAVLSKLGAPPAPEPPKKRDKILPAPLLDYVDGGLDAVSWRPVGMGVKQSILKTDGDAKVRLIYIPSGVAIPDHGHAGTEMTLVLNGAFRDEDGEYHRGDIEIADQDVHHTPVAFGPDDCLCIAAADAKLKFTSLLPRLAQPFLRI